MKKYYYDFHIHSCLSPCGDKDMTPNNIVNMAKLNGLDIIALTDHNSSGNCAAAAAIGEREGLIVLSGIEVTTAEEIHVLCLFAGAREAEGFARALYNALPDIKNRPDIYGEQVYMNSLDEPVGTEPRLLANATSIGLDDIPEMAAAYGGAVALAHIDRHANGVLSILGTIEKDMGFRLAEVSKNADAKAYKKRFPFLFFIADSDAHTLWEIAEKGGENFLLGDFLSPKDVIDHLNHASAKNFSNSS